MFNSQVENDYEALVDSLNKETDNRVSELQNQLEVKLTRRGGGGGGVSSSLYLTSITTIFHYISLLPPLYFTICTNNISDCFTGDCRRHQLT